jgi:hypothetical protein
MKYGNISLQAALLLLQSLPVRDGDGPEGPGVSGPGEGRVSFQCDLPEVRRFDTQQEEGILNKPQKIKYKKNDWLNTQTRTPMYGIDARVDGKWHYVAEDGKPLLYQTAEERDRRIKELRRAQG